jgi:hypothetical protein
VPLALFMFAVTGGSAEGGQLPPPAFGEPEGAIPCKQPPEACVAPVRADDQTSRARDVP